MSSNDVRSPDRQLRLDVALAILVLFGAPVLSAANVSAHVVHIYNDLWGVSILLAVLLRWRTHLPLRAPLYRIVVTATILVITLWILALLPPPSTERGIDVTSVSRVWLFAAAALAVPAAIGHELFFRGVIYNLARRKGIGAAVAVSGLLPTIVLLPFGASPPAMFVATATGLLLATSRAVTGSLAPALLAQVLLSLSGVAFILLVAWSAVGPSI